MSVKLSLIALFLELDLDYLCAARTAPYHSFRNPAERVMSVLNLGLQSVGIARRRMEDEVESAISNCNSVTEIRRKAKDDSSLKEALLDSVAPAKTIPSSVTQRLKLKGKPFSVDVAAQEDEICQLWSSLRKVDPAFCLDHTDKVSTKSLTPKMNGFISHCCCQRYYFFEVKKCGESACQICAPIQMPSEEFSKIKRFPDSVMNTDTGHYKTFGEVYGTVTTEDHRPSKNEKRKRAPMQVSIRNVKNSGLMLLCEECGMWRLVYAKRKLTKAEASKLNAALDGLSFSCESPLQDLDLEDCIQSEVYVQDLQCGEPVEPLYYAANYQDILCVYCCEEVTRDSMTQEYYPQCEDCQDKQKIKKKN